MSYFDLSDRFARSSGRRHGAGRLLSVLARGTAAALAHSIAALGILFARGSRDVAGNGTLFHEMLVVTPFTSLFKLICLALAFFTDASDAAVKTPRHR